MTSTTPNALDNNFYDSTSTFNTPLSLRSCSLYKDFYIGIVQDEIGCDYNDPNNVCGDKVLDAIFKEINDAFSSASQEGLTLMPKYFANRDDMEDYVKKKSYRENSLCFALGWK